VNSEQKIGCKKKNKREKQNRLLLLLFISRGGVCEGFLGRQLFVFSFLLTRLFWITLFKTALYFVVPDQKHLLRIYQSTKRYLKHIYVDNSPSRGAVFLPGPYSFEGLLNDESWDKKSELVFPSKGIRLCWDTTQGETPETRPTGTMWYSIITPHFGVTSVQQEIINYKIKNRGNIKCFFFRPGGFLYTWDGGNQLSYPVKYHDIGKHQRHSRQSGKIRELIQIEE
jgi:hypothetical protein